MSTLDARVRDLWTYPPNGQAVSHEGRWYTWSDLTGLADAVTPLLGAAGLDVDMPLVVGLENSPAIVSVVLTCLSSGRRTRFINAMQSVDRLLADLERLEPAVLVVSPTLAYQLADADVSCRVVVAGPGVEVAVVRTADVPSTVTTPESAQDAGALELFTSGTTGPAKRVTLRVAQIESALKSVLQHHGGAVRSDHSQSPALIATPIAHIGGLWGILQSLVSGRRFVLLERFRLQEWLEAVRDHRPKTTGLPPAALRMVYDADVPREWLSSLRTMNAGTAPLEPDLVDCFLDRYGVPILNVYGATEFAGAVAGWSLPLFERWWTAKRGSVGRPQPGVEMRVVDEEGRPVAANAPGMLQLRAGQTGRDTWVQTTDRARIDDDGFLWIDGRADDVIIRGGFKVDPAVVRAALESHADVSEAAVYPLPDRRLGQVPVAAVQLTDGAAVPEPEELRDHCRTTLTSYEVPAQVRIVNELPRTAAMKISAEGVIALFAEPEELVVPAPR